MQSFSKMFGTELKITIRHMDSVIFGIIFPLVMVFLLGTIYGDKLAYEGASHTKLQLAFGAFVAIGICATGLMGLPLVIADYRHRKILKRFKVTPISPARLLIVHVAISFLLAVVSASATALAAKYVFGYTMRGSIVQFLLAFVFVAITIYSLGIFIASISPNMKIANLACTLVYFPMLLLSGATVPYEILPTALQTASNIFPLTQGIKLLKMVSLGEPVNYLSMQFILMAGTGIICIIGSLRFFKWE